MKLNKSTSPVTPGVLLVVLLAAVLLFLFWQCFLPGYVHFSNDGPLGAQKANFIQLPQAFTGMWDDLNSVGFAAGSYSPSITAVIRGTLGAVGFSKFFPPIALLILGVGAWTFFRQLRFTPAAAILGGLAMALNSAFFSAACWGVAPQQIAVGIDFMALALIVSNTKETSRALRWTRLALAGMAVGIGVMEGADNGAIFSVFIAGFALFYALTEEGPLLARISRGIGRVAVIAVFALFLAFQTVVSLVGSQIVGIAGMQDTAESQGDRWDWATQWSMPKSETLCLVVPGLFGYRMNTPGGGNYWGKSGGDPAWQRYFDDVKDGKPAQLPGGAMRFSGGSPYVGVLVAVLAIWAFLQSLSKTSVFSPRERYLVRFWSVVAVVTLLLAYGRFAVFYRLVYTLPYFSTIRNPSKFIAVTSFSLVVLFAYGVHGLCRKYATAAATLNPKGWWNRASAFDRCWAAGSVLGVVLCLIGWGIYSNFRPELEKYLVEMQRLEALSRNQGFNADGALAMAHAQSGFSVRQVGWFMLFLGLDVGVVLWILRGAATGARAHWGGILLGILLVADLGLVDQNWVVRWDYVQKYDLDPADPARTTNPVIDRLRQKSYEGRTVILPRWFSLVFRVQPELIQAEGSLDQLYGLEWAQHHFPYYNIQSLDVIQLPRVPADLKAFEQAVQFTGTPDTLPRVARRWELTNTRYLLAGAFWLDVFNGAIDPAKHRFRIVERFDLGLKSGVTAYSGQLEEVGAFLSTNGNYAIIEFTGALPRAKLYANWVTPANDPASLSELQTPAIATNQYELAYLHQMGTNDFLTLKKLSAPDFDPHQIVLLASPLPPPAAATAGQDPGTVEFTSYATKEIVLKAEAKTPAVLLLNDKYDPNWKVLVDHQPAPLLRCNFLMRGVALTPGSHVVEFQYRPPFWPMYVSLGAWLVAFGLIGRLYSARRREVKSQP